MTVLSQKVSHQDLDSVCQIKADELYLKAKLGHVPFHQWHDWVEQEIDTQYIKALYCVTDPSTDADDVRELSDEKKSLFS